MLFAKVCSALMVVLLSASSAWAEPYKTIEWIDLLPQKDLDALNNGPEIVHDTPEVSVKKLVEKIAKKNKKSQPKTAYDRAMVSTNVRPEFDLQRIRIPSYIVPLEFNAAQKTTEFFLVPYFGACIHIPPPPPNQLIHVVYPQGFLLESLQDPFWIEGTIHTQLIKKNTTVAAYTLTVNSIKPYE